MNAPALGPRRGLFLFLTAAAAAATASTVALPTPPAAATVLCEGIPATIVGSEESDHLIGTEGADVIAALGGHDVVYGLGGNDRICLGTGDDVGYGGAGNDRYYPDFGGDGVYDDDTSLDSVTFEGATSAVNVDLGAHTASGGAGTDVLWGIDTVVGSSHDDVLVGSDTANHLYGGGGDDTIDAGGGDDVITPGPGEDDIDGGPGTDFISFVTATAGVTVNLTAGTASGEGADVVVGAEGALGGPANDRLIGDAGSNWLEGLGGNDTIEGRRAGTTG